MSRAPASRKPSDPFYEGFAITPHDTNALAAETRGLWIGGVGNVALRFAGDTTDTLISAVPAGTLLPFCVTHVRATLTTATLIIGLT